MHLKISRAAGIVLPIILALAPCLSATAHEGEVHEPAGPASPTTPQARPYRWQNYGVGPLYSTPNYMGDARLRKDYGGGTMMPQSGQSNGSKGGSSFNPAMMMSPMYMMMTRMSPFRRMPGFGRSMPPSKLRGHQTDDQADKPASRTRHGSKSQQNDGLREAPARPSKVDVPGLASTAYEDGATLAQPPRQQQAMMRVTGALNDEPPSATSSFAQQKPTNESPDTDCQASINETSETVTVPTGQEF